LRQRFSSLNKISLSLWGVKIIRDGAPVQPWLSVRKEPFVRTRVLSHS
jgi:hypothetical protein